MIVGGSGDDQLYGNAGNDTMAGTGGQDHLDGGDGVNTVSFFNSDSNIHVDLSRQGDFQSTGVGNQDLSNFKNVLGSIHDDAVTGDGQNNVIDGNGGDDTLDGGSGVDTLSYASAGHGVQVSLLAPPMFPQHTGVGDQVILNFENLLGSSFADTLTGTQGANVVDGSGGKDTIDGAGGDDTLIGGGGGDTVSYDSTFFSGVTVSLALQGAAQDTGVGSQTLSGFANLTGGHSADLLTGDDGANVVDGGSGKDTIDGHGGDDTLIGGGDGDTVSYSSAVNAVSVSLAQQGGAQATGVGSQTLSGFANLFGSTGADRLTGDGAANVIDGDGGNDTLAGNGGSDTVSYASAATGVTVSLSQQGVRQVTGVGSQMLTGFSNLDGSAFADTLKGDAGANVINGGGGNDTIYGLGGDDILAGGAGTNAVDYSNAGVAVHVDLSLQGAAQDTGVGMQTLTGFSVLRGSTFADTLTGDQTDNRIIGLSGYDTIDGHGGDDTLAGGGDGATVSYGSANAHGVHVSLALQGAAQDTGVGSQKLTGFSNLSGSAFADRLTGDADDNVIQGGGGADTINGGGGNDTISNLGAGGLLLGNAGDDQISTSGHGQYLDGGAGADTYDFRALVGIRAATLGEIGNGDIVALGTAAANQGLTQFVAVDKFDGQAGEVIARYHGDTDRTVYKFDLDGDGVADTRIVAKGGHYDFSQFTGVDTSNLANAVAPDHGGLVI